MADSDSPSNDDHRNTLELLEVVEAYVYEGGNTVPSVCHHCGKSYRYDPNAEQSNMYCFGCLSQLHERLWNATSSHRIDDIVGHVVQLQEEEDNLEEAKAQLEAAHEELATARSTLKDIADYIKAKSP